jgi:hemolysin-activating ACP:hemolysin acyltransferase
MNSKDVGLVSDVLKSLEPAQVGAVFSRLFAASIGDMVVVLSRSSAHKHHSLADIEWMVMPPVTAGQFYVVEAMDTKRGFRAPVAAVTWAFVSDELDQLLQKQAESIRRLRPDQWNCGAIGWLIDAAGDAEGVRAALQWLAAGPFKERPLKVTVRGVQGETQVTTLTTMLAGYAEEAGSAAGYAV